MKAQPGVDLILSRFAESEWRGIIRPWLEEGRGRLERAIVVAPTRGQTHALKRRCLDEGVALLGVEFLTPGLARGKRAQPPGIGRSLQILVLRTLIEARLARTKPDDSERGIWKSLESDVETALGDFEDLIRGGFGPENFPRAELREVFGELAAWVGDHGYFLGPSLDLEAGLAPPPPGSAPVAERVLILAGGAEGWGDFFGLAALARRCPSVTVVLADPEFRAPSDEAWVEVWRKLLGVEDRLNGAEDPGETCSAVADLWNGGAGSADKAEVVIGRSRSDEMRRVADAVERLLSEGADNIAVILPGAGSAHARLVRLLGERGVPFADLIGTAGLPPVDIRIQRAIVDFYDRGCRLEELLAIWPLLRSQNLSKLSLGEAREACQRLFDRVQSHLVEPHVGLLEGSAKANELEVGRVARLLLPGWPRKLAPADALARFEAVRDRLLLSEPEGWRALREFAGRAEEPMPAGAILDAIRAFLPEKGPAPGAAGRAGFARVTLTTFRRAAGVAWSDAIFAASDTAPGIGRREASCWLGDEARGELNRKGRFSLGVATGGERDALDRRLLSAIARDTRRRVIFSAARFSEEEPDVRLGPSPWLERVMWSKGLISKAGTDGFGWLGEPPPAVSAAPAGPWRETWRRRRDPAAPFDEYFLAEPAGRFRPDGLSASQIEEAVKDPAQLWFGAVLRVRRIGWGSFARDRRKTIGTAVHGVLAAAMRGTPAEGDFLVMPDRPAARARLDAALAALRARWPGDTYWDSFHLDVCRAARELLDRVYELPRSPFAAVEIRVPAGASVPVGGSARILAYGRMDLVLSDRPGWDGARMEVVDYKTGGASKLSARRMASSGSAVQLGVYLHAALSVGAEGTIWMLKPEERPMKVGSEELGRASARLAVLGCHLERGIYGALTPDRGEFTHGFDWPLACAPIGFVVLERKFAATFGSAPLDDPENDSDE